MALSKRFGSLRRRGGDADADVAMDEAFLQKKIYLMSQMAPRHSWGGTASTQTKIDVRDEELESIKGNLAFRFKAAKAIYARVEDLAVEPLTRDESLGGRSQLNKTTQFNLEKLLGYNARPCHLDEMGVKLYYKYNSFIRRKLKACINRPPATSPAVLRLPPATTPAAVGLPLGPPAVPGGGQKRRFGDIADDSSLSSVAKRDKVYSRIASKSCLPQVKNDVDAASISLRVNHHPNQAAPKANDDRRSHVASKSPRSSSSTESASSSQMGEDAEAVPVPYSSLEGARGVAAAGGMAAPFSATFRFGDGVDPLDDHHQSAAPGGGPQTTFLPDKQLQQQQSTGSYDFSSSLSHLSSSISSAPHSLGSYGAPSAFHANFVNPSPAKAASLASSSSSVCSNAQVVKDEAEVSGTGERDEAGGGDDDRNARADAARAAASSTQKRSVSFALDDSSAPDSSPCSKATPVTKSSAGAAAPPVSALKKTKKAGKPKVIPQVAIDGYDGSDPRSYDSVNGIKLGPDLRFLDIRRLVINWVRHETRHKKKEVSLPGEEVDLGIYLKNWRSLALVLSEPAVNRDRNPGAPESDIKPDCRLLDTNAGTTKGRRSVDPRPAAKILEQRRLGGRSEYPQPKSLRTGANAVNCSHSASLVAVGGRGDAGEPTANLNNTLS